MRVNTSILLLVLVCACKPGQPLGLLENKGSVLSNPDATPETQPKSGINVQAPPPDPEEETKALEPAIISGAYLYCEADADDIATMEVGCRVEGIAPADWAAATKDLHLVNKADGTEIDASSIFAPTNSHYQLAFAGDRQQQANLEMQVTLALPQGSLALSTTISPYNVTLASLRQTKGLALIASTETRGFFAGIDKKSWNLWMPVKIPRFISNRIPYSPKDSSSWSSSFGESGSLRLDSSYEYDSETAATLELSFDSTVCTYQTGSNYSPRYKKEWQEEAQLQDFKFVSCTKTVWEPDQWVRSKTISLRIVGHEDDTGPRTVGLLLETGP